MSAAPFAPARICDLRTPDGRTLRTYDTGDPDGELVIVHHGTPCCGQLAPWWADDAAGRSIRLVGFDRPGYGGSDRQPGRTVADIVADVALVADAYGADRFRTWGVSGGGPHALACAALLPERVRAAAALASIAPYDASGLDYFAGMGQDNIDEMGAALDGEETLAAYLAAAHTVLMRTGAEDLAAHMRTILPAADVAVFTGSVGAFVHAWMTEGMHVGYHGWLDDDLAFVRPWGFDVGAITVPVLLLQGKLDLMVPATHGEWLTAHIPDVEAQLTADDGHLTLIVDVSRMHAWLLDH